MRNTRSIISRESFFIRRRLFFKKLFISGYYFFLTRKLWVNSIPFCPHFLFRGQFYLFFDPNFFASLFFLLSIFLRSSSAGSSSGTIPLSHRYALTHLLFFTCSAVISFSHCRFFPTIFTLVTSVAKSFALIVTAGRKSASGLFFGTHNVSFISPVLCHPNNA